MMPDFCDIRGGKNYFEESEKILKEGLYDNASYYAQSQTTGSAPAKTWYDRLGREILNQAVAFDGQWVDVETRYDNLGRLWKVSEPFFHTASPTQYTVYDYDPLGRNYQTTLPTGVKLKTDYSQIGSNIITTYKTDDTQTWEQVTQTMNGYGQPVTIEEIEGGEISYLYNSMGLPKSITTNGAEVTMEYDIHGNRTLIDDPDAGEITTVYNAYDELTSQTDANQHTYTMTYDKLGRITSRTGAETTTWAYSTTPGHLGELTSVTASNGTAQSYNYDALGRVTLQTETISGQEFTKSYAYDNYGRLQTENWNTGFGIMYQYNQNGYLSHVKTQNNQLIWQGQAYNARGQVTDYLLGDDYRTTKSWDDYGFTEQILTQTTGSTPNDRQKLGYNFDELKGNLLSRTDYLPYNKIESFYYDNLNRLTNENVSSGTQLSTGFALNGNITQKSDIGAYTYDEAGPHAVTGLTNTTGNLLPVSNQSVDYTAFNKASYISQGDYSYYITYGPDRQRSKTILNQSPGENTILTKYYAFGDYEKEITEDGTRHLHYIAGGDGLAAIYVKYDNAPDEMYFILKDHLGSITGAINSETGIVYRQNFDAWGRKRNPVDWSYSNIPEFPFDRGYTGHEHLKWFGLINMNGRMYDAALGRFLSPDLIVQNPSWTQSYNRYSYCFNNPLNATDPSGYTRQTERDEMRSWYMNGGPTFGPYLNAPSRFGPGSGNHWSDYIRSEYNNFLLMNSSDFDKRYGDGAAEIGYEELYKDPFLREQWAKGNVDVEKIRNNKNGEITFSSAQYDAGVIVLKYADPWATDHVGHQIIPLFTTCFINNPQARGSDNAAAGFGLGVILYWGETLNTLYEMQESKNLVNTMARAEAYKSVTGTIPKSMRTSISYGKTMTTVTKAAGRGLFVVGTAMTVYDMVSNPTTENLILGSADIIMGVVSIGCPVVGLVYFTGRIIYDISSEK